MIRLTIILLIITVIITIIYFREKKYWVCNGDNCELVINGDYTTERKCLEICNRNKKTDGP